VMGLQASPTVMCEVDASVQATMEKTQRTVYIKNVGLKTSVEQLCTMFRQYGTIVNARIKSIAKPDLTGPKVVPIVKRFAFLEFSKVEEARSVVKMCYLNPPKDPCSFDALKVEMSRAPKDTSIFALAPTTGQTQLFQCPYTGLLYKRDNSVMDTGYTSQMALPQQYNQASADNEQQQVEAAPRSPMESEGSRSPSPQTMEMSPCYQRSPMIEGSPSPDGGMSPFPCGGILHESQHQDKSKVTKKQDASTTQGNAKGTTKMQMSMVLPRNVLLAQHQAAYCCQLIALAQSQAAQFQQPTQRCYPPEKCYPPVSNHRYAPY